MFLFFLFFFSILFACTALMCPVSGRSRLCIPVLLPNDIRPVGGFGSALLRLIPMWVLLGSDLSKPGRVSGGGVCSTARAVCRDAGPELWKGYVRRRVELVQPVGKAFMVKSGLQLEKGKLTVLTLLRIEICSDAPNSTPTVIKKADF